MWRPLEFKMGLIALAIFSEVLKKQGIKTGIDGKRIMKTINKSLGGEDGKVQRKNKA